jgi:hypothetical protein
MKIIKILSISISLTLLVSGSVFGATIKVPDDYTTIQAAIGGASDGDLILVAPGTYTGTVNFIGKNITVRSDGDGDPATYDILPKETIHEGDRILFNSGETEEAVLDGFTVRYIETGYGGSYASPTIKNCIQMNRSCSDGCGTHVWESSATFINCIFYGNDAGSDGGAMKVGPESSVKVLNCTFFGNDANYGGAISCNGSSSATLINSIFWGNTASNGHEIVVLNNSSVTVSYSDIQGGQPEVFVDGTSSLNWVPGTNINLDPLFVNTAGEDFHLQYGSPCISAATASDPDLPLTDYEGDPRVVGPAPDMGADEFMPQYIEVVLDIKPGSYPTSINPRSEGKIPVAILSSMDFDAPIEVDTESLTFGPAGDEESLAFCSRSSEDVNDDGYDDLVCHFYTRNAEFQCGDSEGILIGKTVDETPLEGIDSVRIVPSACR